MKKDEPVFSITGGYDYKGMGIRDYFAGLAMQGLISQRNFEDTKEISEWSYKLADAMMKERSEEE
jgi:hypothetical protein